MRFKFRDPSWLHRLLAGLSASQFATHRSCGWHWVDGSVGFSLGAQMARDELSNLVEAHTDHSTIGPGSYISKHHAFCHVPYVCQRSLYLCCVIDIGLNTSSQGSPIPTVAECRPCCDMEQCCTRWSFKALAQIVHDIVQLCSKNKGKEFGEVTSRCRDSVK